MQFLSFGMSFHLVLSFVTFSLVYTFLCSNNLHRKSLVLFGNWLWLLQAKMSYFLPLFPETLVFYSLGALDVSGLKSMISGMRTFNSFQTGLFSVISVISDILLPFQSFPVLEMANSLNSIVFTHFIHFTIKKFKGDIFLPSSPSNVLKCHPNVIFYTTYRLVLLNSSRYFNTT